MSSSQSLGKRELVARAASEMNVCLVIPRWSVEEKLVLAARILFSHGHDSGIAGQISARRAGAPHFLTQKMGQGFDEIAIEDLLEVDGNLSVRVGNGMPNPATRFHGWIYRERTDVQCIIHTHPLHVSAWSMLGRPLEIAHMDCCGLFEDIAFLAEWPGIPLGDEEGKIISQALGHKRAVLLGHHGLVVAGRTVEEACVLALQVERAARLQLLAEGAGKVQPINPERGREAHDWLLLERRVQATFHYHARRVIAEDAQCFAQTIPESVRPAPSGRVGMPQS